MAVCLGGVPRDVQHLTSTTNPTPTPTPTSTPSPSTTPKRKSTSDPSYFPHLLSVRRSGVAPTKRCRSQQDHSYMELHQSTCLNLNSSDNSDSDLWILPDFEDWEYDDAPSLAQFGSKPFNTNPGLKRNGDRQSDMKLGRQSEWGPLLQRAASSNRERLRLRLEGDGWDFVGGKYGYGGGSEEWRGPSSGSEESVDEEFDVVILLPEIAVS